MTITGWIFLSVSTLSVWSLAIWCYFKVLTTKDPDPLVEPPDGSEQ